MTSMFSLKTNLISESEIICIIMNFHRDLEMLKVGCFEPNEPLITTFLLMEDYKSNPCPRFYGKPEDKNKVYHALKEEIHPEVHAN